MVPCVDLNNTVQTAPSSDVFHCLDMQQEPWHSRLQVCYDLLRLPVAQPRCVRVDTPGCFTWTISNLHYPADTYSVRLDTEGTAVIVSTTNKK